MGEGTLTNGRERRKMNIWRKYMREQTAGSGPNLRYANTLAGGGFIVCGPDREGKSINFDKTKK